MTSKTDLRQQITQKIINALDNNTIPWRRPWKVSKNSGRAMSIASKRTYSGVNPLLLNLHNLRYGFESKWWGTFQQFKALGLKIKSRPKDVEPGSWGCQIVFYKRFETKTTNTETGENETKENFVLRTFTVFNAEQVEGADEFLVSSNDNNQVHETERHKLADQLIESIKVSIEHRGDQAYYAVPSPLNAFPNHLSGDYIVMPPVEQFDTVRDYYLTLFHELGHFAEVRTDWHLKNHSYALSELAAEMCSCYVAEQLGIKVSENLGNHASYLKHWLSQMKADSNYIFKAASQASKATDYLFSCLNKTETTTEIDVDQIPF